MSDQSGDREPVRSGGTRRDDVVSDLLSPFVELLSVAGASISVGAGPGQSTLGATDALAARLEQLQFDIGEGPHWDALRGGREVLVPDVRDRRSTWPIFAAEAGALGVGAVFAFPMRLGAATVGVVDLYCSAPAVLSPGDVSTARALAAVAAGSALRLAARSASDEEAADDTSAPELRRVVHQATGMLLVQLGVTATAAFARLRAHAFASGVPLESVAQDVVAGRLTFHDESATE